MNVRGKVTVAHVLSLCYSHSMTTLSEETITLIALESRGVDNWVGYDYAMEQVSEDASDEDILAALENHGVDNWVGYDDAIEYATEQIAKDSRNAR